MIAMIEQLPQTRACAGQNWCAMCEKHSLNIIIEEFSERFTHSLFIRAIFSGQKRKAVGLEIDQCISDNQ